MDEIQKEVYILKFGRFNQHYLNCVYSVCVMGNGNIQITDDFRTNDYQIALTEAMRLASLYRLEIVEDEERD